MEFKEPDLEELIQHDLRSEINKILSQSEVENLEADPSKLQQETGSRQSPFGTGASRVLTHQPPPMDIKKEATYVKDEPMVQADFDVIDSSSMENLGQQDQVSRSHQEISGHFAVGSYSDFSGEMGRYPMTVAEHNDLQSLTWLTTVDVHALQKLTEQGTVITTAMQHSSRMNRQDGSSSQEAMPEHRSVIQMVPPGNMQISTHENSNSNHQIDPNQNPHQPTSPTRYMPMQPHLSPDGRRFLAQQRYQAQPHPGGGPMGRNSYEGNAVPPKRYMPMGHHHPYPPPPYNVNRSGYIHGVPLMHPRYQHHGQQPKVYPKPVYSYSCLIAMALYNSKTGCLPVSEIYNFMMENYPYFKTAPDGWKNSVRHNLSLNKCFEKVEKPNGSQRKGCLWALNPAKIAKMKEEVQKWKRKDPESIRRSMSNPEELDRELEEMRRADEEAARRRMLSLSSHGLTAQSIHHHHEHSAHQQSHPPGLLQMRHHATNAHMSPSASGSRVHHGNSQRCSNLHFSTELAQQNFAMTLARSASQPVPGRSHQYDQHLQSSLGRGMSPSISHGCNPTNNTALNSQESSSDMIVLTPSGDKSSFFSSPHSGSSASSNASLLATFTDCTSTFVGEEDLDASLADLAGLHESLWDATGDPHPGPSSDTGDTLTDPETKSAIIISEVNESLPMTSSDGPIRLPPVIRMLSSSQSEQPSPDTPDYKSSTGQRVDNFGRDMSHFPNSNIKPVVMMQ